MVPVSKPTCIPKVFSFLRSSFPEEGSWWEYLPWAFAPKPVPPHKTKYPAVVAGQWGLRSLLRGAGTRHSSAYTHPLHNHSHLVFPGITPCPGGGWHIQVRTPEAVGPACRTWSKLIQCLAILSSVLCPWECREKSWDLSAQQPLEQGWGFPATWDWRRSSGIHQLLWHILIHTRKSRLGKRVGAWDGI